MQETKYTILICDDDPGIRTVTQLILERKGYKTVSCENGRNIYSLIRDKRPDLILLDYHLKDIGGDNITKQIKSDDSTKDIQILLFSASNYCEKIAKEIKADGFIKKPFDIIELENIIKKHLAPKIDSL